MRSKTGVLDFLMDYESYLLSNRRHNRQKNIVIRYVSFHLPIFH
jgi:hypothetical protein